MKAPPKGVRRLPLVWLAASLSIATTQCGDDAPTPAPEPGHGHGSGSGHGHGGGTDPETGHGSDEAAAEDREAPLATVVRSEGDVRIASGVIRDHMPLERGERVRVGAGAHIDIDVREGARLSVDPESDLRIGDIGPARVLFVSGMMHIVSPPEDGPRAILRIATPEATIAISGPGEAFLAVDDSGTTIVMTLAGLFAVSTGEADTRGRLREIDLGTGRTVVVAQRMSEPVAGPQRLDEARAQVVALLSTTTPADGARRRHDLGAAISSLDEGLSGLEAEARRGGELTAAHRAAVAAANETESMRLQGELVLHSTQLYRLREVAISRWERVRVLALTVEPAPEPDPVAVRAERVRGLLGE